MEKKPWYESKTIWIAIVTGLTAILPLIPDLLKALDVSPAFAEKVAAVIVVILSVIAAYRRAVLTETPAQITK
jgi:hypothetical protein